jgi:hypothetical protein
VSDAMEYFRKATRTGHHFSMIYGDYCDELKALCSMVDIKVETVV